MHGDALDALLRGEVGGEAPEGDAQPGARAAAPGGAPPHGHGVVCQVARRRGQALAQLRVAVQKSQAGRGAGLACVPEVPVLGEKGGVEAR